MSSVTPNRQTKIAIDVSTTNCLRQPNPFFQSAQNMIACRYGSLVSQNILKQPYTPAWTIQPNMLDPGDAIYSGQPSSFLGASDVEMATNWAARESFLKPTDLVGVTYNAAVVSSGVNEFVKRVGASGTWAGSLTTDEPTPAFASFGGTTLTLDVDPVIQTKNSAEPNQCYWLQFSVPQAPITPDYVCALSFGGNVTTEGQSRLTQYKGGRFCLLVRGDGRAILLELANSGWAERYQFAWGNPTDGGVRNYFGTILIQPFANDKITFISKWGSFVDPGLLPKEPNLPNVFARAAEAKLSGQVSKVHQYTYEHDPDTAGYFKLDYSTGPGNALLRVRRDLRGPFRLAKYKYPTTGVLVDAPFLVPGAVSNSDIFTVQGRTWKLGGTSITAQMYTQNGVALSSAGTNRFYAVAGVNAYRVKITFNASSDQVQTPVLYSYQVLLDGLFQSYTPAATYLTTYIQATAFSGPGTSVSEDSFQAIIQDRHGELPNLYTRTGQRAQLRIYNATTGAIRSILGEGYVFRNTATPLGQDGGYPAYGTWKQYDLNVNGQWERLTRKRLKTHLTLGEDPNAASNVLNIGGNGKMPYFIEDAIGLLLQCGGFASTQYITPPYTFRLMAADPDLLTIPAGTQVSEALLHLIEDWLNGYLIWDPTAGATGSWRIIRPPVYKVGTTAMASFTESVGGAKLPMYTAEGSSTAEMVHGTFKRTPIKPAANVLILRGSRGVVAAYTNTRSFNAGGSSTADPTHVDFIGEEVPLVWINPAVDNQAAANLLLRRLARFAAFGYYEYEWVAPYLLLSATQTGDSYQNASYDRPLRIGDVVSVEGPTGTANVMIRRVKWLGDHDVTQMASYQAISIL